MAKIRAKITVKDLDTGWELGGVEVEIVNKLTRSTSLQGAVEFEAEENTAYDLKVRSDQLRPEYKESGQFWLDEFVNAAVPADKRQRYKKITASDPSVPELWGVVFDAANKSYDVRMRRDPLRGGTVSAAPNGKVIFNQPARSRPLSRDIRAAYSQVSYKLWKGNLFKSKVWELVGGSLGQSFDEDAKANREAANTCATRVSYAFNYSGYPIQKSDRGWIYRNDSKVTYKGKAGDDMKYIVSAPYMEKYLREKWGPPDAILKTNAEATAFEATLGADQVAVFAGTHHAGLIMQGYKADYVLYDPSVVPVSAWKLPP